MQDAARREISKLAVWSVTSAKPGNGVELLRDSRDDTYWQSDGTQPHLVNIQFQRKVRDGSQAILTATAVPTESPTGCSLDTSRDYMLTKSVDESQVPVVH